MEYIEFSAKITPLEVGREILIANLSELSFESFVETETGLMAYIQSKNFNIAKIKSLQLLENSEFTVTYSTKVIEDRNWNEEWEKSFNPINVDNRCYIRAHFHDKIDNIEYDITIDPKMSFGTGHHETTYLVIKKLLEMNLEGKNFLDMGCGTGVLAILAKMKNSKYVKAIDIEEWAYNNTIENIRNNNCDDIEVSMGGVEEINTNDFDVIVANINRNILLRDMSKYNIALLNGGDLILSGFFDSDREVLLNQASEQGLKLFSSETKNDWAMLHLVKE